MPILAIASVPAKIEYKAPEIENKTIVAVEDKEAVAVNITPSKDLLQLYAEQTANKYGVSFEEMSVVIACESSWNPNAHNPADPNSGSHGISQFQTGTFNHFSKEAGIENGDPYNPYQAIETMAYMFSLGVSGKRHWSCFRMNFE